MSVDAKTPLCYDFIMQQRVVQSLLEVDFMKRINRHWYSFGLAVALVSLAVLVCRWDRMSVLLRCNTISFIAILLHQFEEYGFPGGECMIFNRVLMGSECPDRYPLNQFSAMLTNCIFTYGIYLLPLLFPNVIWLGIAPMLMGIMQFVFHGLMTNLRMKTCYNPGLAAVVLLHIPVGVYYLHYITAQGLTSGRIWMAGLLYTLLATGLILGFLTYVVLPDRNTRWPFAPEELKRFRVEEKLQKKQLVPKRTMLDRLENIRQRQ